MLGQIKRNQKNRISSGIRTHARTAIIGLVMCHWSVRAWVRKFDLTQDLGGLDSSSIIP